MLTPGQLWRWSRVAVYVAVALVMWTGFRDLHWVRVQADDHGTPEVGPDTLVLVRTLAEDDGEIILGSLYFLHTERGAQLVRVVALANEALRRDGSQVFAGARVLSVPAERVTAWPERVPPGSCLVLLDDPAAAGVDSRQLGPVATEQLLWRVTVPLSLLPG